MKPSWQLQLAVRSECFHPIDSPVENAIIERARKHVLVERAASHKRREKMDDFFCRSTFGPIRIVPKRLNYALGFSRTVFLGPYPISQRHGVEYSCFVLENTKYAKCVDRPGVRSTQVRLLLQRSGEAGKPYSSRR